MFAAHGGREVEAVTYGQVDPETWSPIRERARRIEVDLLVQPLHGEQLRREDERNHHQQVKDDRQQDTLAPGDGGQHPRRVRPVIVEIEIHEGLTAVYQPPRRLDGIRESTLDGLYTE